MRALVFTLALAFASVPLHAQSLYAQSIQTALARPGLEILLVDLRTRETLVNTFAGRAIPAGSLLKPFVAVAYGQTHSGATPTVVCHGHADRCWKPEGHGAITLPNAIAQSCNAYFLALASGLGPAGIASIPYLPPPPDASPETLIGLNPGWLIAPARLVEAYAQLLAAPQDRTHSDILAGMRASAAHGTASRIGWHAGGVLAKTGTAPCVELPCKASGDGLALAAVPATHPTLLLLVRRRGTTGAMTAASANHLLSQLEALHAE